MTSASDASESLSYSYDALARLRGVSGTYIETYTYDDIGNLVNKGSNVQLGYPAAMQARPHAPLTYIPTQNGSYQTYWYDNNGNMTWRDEYAPGQTYMAFWQGYTPDNKLYIAVGYGWNANAGQWEFNNVYSFFYYDADGQRVRKDDPNGTTAYAGPGFEQNMYTGVQRVTYSFNGQVVAVRNGATTSWIHSDHLGSASLATDYTGVPVAGSETRYTPWGEVRTGGTLPTDRGFTSQRREDNIRLNDYVARFYNPFIGKFIQPDSVVPGAGNPQAFNRFAYVFNNPLAFADPSGHDPFNTVEWRAWCRSYCANGEASDQSRQLYLYSLSYKGGMSGSYTWTAADYDDLLANRNEIYISTAGRSGVGDFDAATSRLAENYEEGEQDQYVAAIGLLFAGLPYDPSGINNVFSPQNLLGGNHIDFGENQRYFPNHGMAGFRPDIFLFENTHHFAGHFALGYFAETRLQLRPGFGEYVNDRATKVREYKQDLLGQQDTRELRVDLNMGYAGGRAGYLYAQSTSVKSLSSIIQWTLR